MTIVPDERIISGASHLVHVTECLHPLAPSDDLNSFKPQIEDSIVEEDVVSTVGADAE